jgi:hypothetical protein
LIGIEDCFQTREREVTGGEQVTVSFGHSMFCLFLYENWHKKNVRGIARERRR